MKFLARCSSILLGVVAVTAVSIPAHATTESSLTIANTGAQSGSLGYVRFTSGSNLTTCPYSVVYLDLSTDQGRAMMSIAITARAGDRKITRVDYTNDGTRCFATLLEI